jgi:hypothetical protein
MPFSLCVQGSQAWTRKNGCTKHRGWICLTWIMWESLLPLRKSIVWVSRSRATFVRVIAAKTNLPRKMTSLDLVWFRQGYTMSGGFTAKQIQVSVHMEETRWRQRQWWMEECLCIWRKLVDVDGDGEADPSAPIFDSLQETNKRRVQGFRKRIAIVSDGTYSFIHLTYMLNLSLTLVIFVQFLQEVRARSRRRRMA